MAKVLVCAAHPDDETYGAAGTILRHTESGDEVRLVIFTKPYPPDWDRDLIAEKREEAESAVETLGLHSVHFLDYPTAQLDTVPQKDLNDELGKIVLDYSPEVVYTTHYNDAHQDHRAVFHATVVAARPIPNSAVKRLLAYELLSSTEWGGHSGAFRPNFYVDISYTLPKKLKAVSQYKSELRAYPHPRSLEAVEALAKKRGSEVGLAAAEAFEVIHLVW
jgi:LmbE family N-acetylglucosaminyl deacetylase